MKWFRWLGIATMAAIDIATSHVATSYAQERFDYEVREDMFRAFGGNEAALKSALATIEAKLQEQPDHAEAMVWRGAARNWMARRAFEAGDSERARALSTAGMADMDRALALEPSNIGVLVPRAAVLLAVARNQREAARMRELAGQSAANFESALALRQNAFPKLGQHNRGEYLSGLAESWALAGNKDMAEGYLRRILAELPNSVYAERASAKLANWDDRRPLNCLSCH
jgi:tetratricopeptide (TPR) repeat protein